MRVIDRYLVRSFAAALLFCLALFFVLFIVIDSFNKLNEGKKQDVLNFLRSL